MIGAKTGMGVCWITGAGAGGVGISPIAPSSTLMPARVTNVWRRLAPTVSHRVLEDRLPAVAPTDPPQGVGGQAAQAGAVRRRGAQAPAGQRADRAGVDGH